MGTDEIVYLVTSNNTCRNDYWLRAFDRNGMKELKGMAMKLSGHFVPSAESFCERTNAFQIASGLNREINITERSYRTEPPHDDFHLEIHTPFVRSCLFVRRRGRLLGRIFKKQKRMLHLKYGPVSELTQHWVNSKQKGLM